MAKANEFFFKYLDEAAYDEDDSCTWLIYGRMAQHYNLNEIAKESFAKVKKQEDPFKPYSCHLLAQNGPNARINLI